MLQFPVRILTRCWFPLLAVSALLWSGSELRAQQALRWKWTQGDILRYEFQQNTQTETSGGGKQMQITIESTMTFVWKIESVDEANNASIEQTIERLRISMKTDKLDPIVYDSSAKGPITGPAREFAEGLKDLIGSAIRMRMSERGEVQSVELSDQLRQSLAENKPAAGPANPLSTPDGIARLQQQLAIVFPEKPLQDGEEWTTSQTAPTPIGPMVQKSQFIYQGTQGLDGTPLQKIALQTAFQIPGEANTPTRLKEGTRKGTIWFDAERGRLVLSEVEQVLVTERPYRDSAIRVRSTSKSIMSEKKS